MLSGAVALRLIGYVYQPLLVPLLIALLGLTGYGELSAALAIATIAIAFCEYGHNATLGTRIANRSPTERETESSLVYPITVYQKSLLLVFAITCMLIWVSLALGQTSAHVLLVVITCVVIPEVFIPTWYYIGTGRLTSLLTYQLIGRATSFSTLGCLVYLDISINTAAAAALCGLSSVVACLLASTFLWRQTRPVFIPLRIKVLVTDLSRQSPFFVGSFASTVTPAVFLLIVADYFSAEILGQYALAGVGWGALRQLSQMGSNIWLVNNSQKSASNSSHRALLGAGLGIACAVATAIGSTLLLQFDNGERWLSFSYRAAADFLILLSLSVAFHSANYSISLHTFCARGLRAAFTISQTAPIAVFLTMTHLDTKPIASEFAIKMVIAESVGLLFALFLGYIYRNDHRHV